MLVQNAAQNQNTQKPAAEARHELGGEGRVHVR